MTRISMLACRRALAVLLAAALAAFAAGAQDSLPPEQTPGGIRYRQGGFGTPEADAMRRASRDYSLMLSFSELIEGKHAFTADVDVRIRPLKGGPEFATHSEGPLMLIDLPPGRYEIVATLSGRSMVRTVEVREAQTERVSFEWGAPG